MGNNIHFFENQGPFSLKFFASCLNCKFYLNDCEVSDRELEDVLVFNVATLKNASDKDLSFLSNAKYTEEVYTTKAKACLIEKKHFDLEGFRTRLPSTLYVILVENAHASFARLSSLFYPREINKESEISTEAYISKSAIIGKKSCIMSNSYIGDNVIIGDNVTIYPNVVVGNNIVIGKDSVIYDSVSLKYCLIGERAIIHSGVRIGQDGFGYAVDKGEYIKVPQIGKVIIGNDVEIGANSTIDRGAIGDTIIGDRTKIDNLVQIGHNVEIGKNCFIVSQVGIAGSTILGDYVVLGGQVGVAGHLKIGSYVQAGAQAGIMKDVKTKEVVWGCPALPIKERMREIVMLKKIINRDK
jgi:UDP-3-O-[3-hydroxymyristoyl] glucosamine N-acyltransferase